MHDAMRRMDAAVEATTERQGKLCGLLRITAPMSFGTLCLGEFLAEFARLHPGIELAIDLDDRKLDLVRDGYDVAVRIGRLADSRLIARKLCVSPRVVCCSPAYARQKALPKAIEGLSEHTCIDYTNALAGQLWRFAPLTTNGKPRIITLRSRIAANNGEIVREMAIAGLGVAVLPLFIVIDALRIGQLIHVLPDEKPLPDTVYAVYPPTRHLPQRARAFIDYLAAVLAHRPPWEGRASNSGRKPWPANSAIVPTNEHEHGV